jgi:hypothetical protein
MLPQANKWKAQRSIKEKLKKTTRREIDGWEGRSSVMVSFNLTREGVHLNGEFAAKELSDIARISRKIEKELRSGK